MKNVVAYVVTKVTIQCPDNAPASDVMDDVMQECDYSFTYTDPVTGVTIVDTDMVAVVGDCPVS